MKHWYYSIFLAIDDKKEKWYIAFFHAVTVKWSWLIVCLCDVTTTASYDVIRKTIDSVTSKLSEQDQSECPIQISSYSNGKYWHTLGPSVSIFLCGKEHFHSQESIPVVLEGGGVGYRTTQIPLPRYPTPRRNMEPEIPYTPPERIWDHWPGRDLAQEIPYPPLNRKTPVKTLPSGNSSCGKVIMYQ